MKRKYSELKAVIEHHGFEFFEGHYNFNFIGVRANNEITNEWDDDFYLAYQKRELNSKTGKKELKDFVFHIDEFTTDPGNYYSKHQLLNEKGVAILARGQHRGIWSIGMHRGKYEAFVQRVNKVQVFRDGNKDGVIDYEVKDFGIFGINLHHGYGAAQIGKNSAGCQVAKDKRKLQELIKIFKAGMSYNGGTVSYTLLDAEDFNALKLIEARKVTSKPRKKK